MESSAPKKSSLLWRVVKRLLIGILLLVVLAAVSGILYQSILGARDARRYPQEGRSIPLGPAFPGVFLNLNCTGSGSPTVILDTGLGVPAAGWDLVQPDVAKSTRVCSYDRAGYGWSTPGPMPRTSEQIARELQALLTAAGEKPPTSSSPTPSAASTFASSLPSIPVTSLAWSSSTPRTKIRTNTFRLPCRPP